MTVGFTRRDAASQKGTVMSDAITEVTPEAPETPLEPVAMTEDAPLGEPGLAALKAEREARADLERQLKEYKDRDKTDTERQAEETETLRRENAELKSGALRASIAADKGVPVHLLSGSTKEELEASADALITFRGERANTPLVVPTEGTSPRPSKSAEKVFVADLFGSGD